MIMMMDTQTTTTTAERAHIRAHNLGELQSNDDDDDQSRVHASSNVNDDIDKTSATQTTGEVSPVSMAPMTTQTQDDEHQDIPDHLDTSPTTTNTVRPQPQAELEASILKLFNIEPDDVAARGQLLTASMTAMAAASTGAVLSQQEQMLASMAPTLMTLFGALSMPPTTLSNTMASNHSSEEENESRSGSFGSKKRRKQSKPVRYGDDGASGQNIFEAMIAAAAAAVAASSGQEQHISQADSGTIARKSDSHESASAAFWSEGKAGAQSELDLQAEPRLAGSGTLRLTRVRSGPNSAAKDEHAAGGATPTTPTTNGSGSGEQQAHDGDDQREEKDVREKNEKDLRTTTMKSESAAAVCSVTRSTAAKTAATSAHLDNSMQQLDDVGDDVHKQQQLLLANVLANFQHKLFQGGPPRSVSTPSLFCPQCNFGPCASDDQLRVHIELEHMAKYSASNNTPAAVAKIRQDLSKLTEQLLVQQLAQQQQQQQQPLSDSSKRKRKRSPHSSRSNSPGASSISSNGGREGDESSNQSVSGAGAELEEGEVAAGSRGSGRSKDVNHNLLRSGVLSHLPPNLITPLISSLSHATTTATTNNKAMCTNLSPSSIIEQLKISTSSSSFGSHLPASTASPSSSSSSTSSSPSSINQHHQQQHESVPMESSNVLASSQQHQQQQQQSQHSALFNPQLSPFQQFLAGNSAAGNGAGNNANFPSNAMLANGLPMPGLRIFNLEAYCELCNKEFCNKYFLKTHKANKHGIYTLDGTPGAPANGSNGSQAFASASSVSPTRSSGNGSPALLQQQQHLQALAAIQQQQQHQAKHPVGNGGSSANSRDANSPSSAAGGYGQSVLTPFTPPMRLNLNMAMVNLDSYCEICQKEFCNKYFLKKHKQKIHGYVYQGDTAIPPSANSPQMQHIQQLQILQQQLAAQQQQQQLIAARSMSPSDELGERKTPSLGTSQLSPSARPHSNPQTTSSLDKLNSHENSSPMSAMMANIASTFGQHPSAISALTPDRLRQMGVINADAFCEICCKEFCNKYFLRTHKINKHGISDPSATSSARNTKDSSSSMFNGLLQAQQQLQQQQQQQAQGSCSNGEGARLASGNGNENSTDEMLEPGQRDPTSYGKSGDDFLNGFSSSAPSAGTLKCDLCPQAFPNSHLMRMHKFYSHNLPYANQEEEDKPREQSEEKRAKLDVPESKKNDDKSETTSRKSNEEEDQKNGKEKPAQRMFEDSDDSDVENDISMTAGMLVSAELANTHSEESGQGAAGLQRLQTLVSDLGEQPSKSEDNGAFSSSTTTATISDGSVRYTCHLCRFMCSSRYHLRAHLIGDHDFPSSDESFAQLMALVEQNRFAPSDQAASRSCTDSEAFCELCNKEFCSKYFLKNHKKNIHGIVEPERASPSGQLPYPASSSSMLNSAMISSLYSQAKTPGEFERLNLAMAMQQQAKTLSPGAVSPAIASMLPNSAPNSSNKFGMVGAGNSQAMAATLKAAMAVGLMPAGEGGMLPMAPSAAPGRGGRGAIMTGRNYCNICNKELCNKYFMKTHMLKMHGINIDEHPIEAASTSTIGGVQCDICQKELCSKYFLKVHKQNTHGIYEDGSAPPILLPQSLQQQQQQQQQQQHAQAQQQRLLAAAAAAQRQSSSHPSLSMAQHQASSAGQSNDPSSMLSAMMAAMAANNSAAYAAAMASAAAAAAARSSSPASSTSSNTSSDKESKLAGVEPDDASNRNFAAYQEVCRFCDRRFKSVKWVRVHMMNDHQDSLQIMRTIADLASLLANATGGSAEQLVRMCFECGQSFADQISVHVHALKDHKMAAEQMALNLVTKFGIMTAMINANNNGENGASNANTDQMDNLSLRQSAEASEDIVLNPSPPTSPQSSKGNPAANEGDDNDEDNDDEKARFQALFLKNSSNFNLALAAAAAGGVDIQSQWISSLLQQQASMDGEPQGLNKSQKMFPCKLCPKTYRQSHSLQRHMIVHKNETNIAKAEKIFNNEATELFKRLQQPLASATASDGGEKPRNKRYRCSKCNKKFRTRELCLVHIRTQHSTVKKATITKQADEMTKTSKEVKSSSLQLPPSPSATSSEGGEAQQESAKPISQPTSVINFAKKGEEEEEEEEDEPQQRQSSPSCEDGEDEDESDLVSHQNDTNQQPSMVCINGEQS